MSTAPGKLSPSEFLAEIQRDLERMKGSSPQASGAPAGPVLRVPGSERGPNDFIQLPKPGPAPASAPGDSLISSFLDVGTPVAEARPPRPAAKAESTEPTAARGNSQINGLLDRVDNLLGPAGKANDTPFVPQAPDSLASAGLLFEDVERIILKYLLSKGSATGRGIAAQVCLNFAIVEPILKTLKSDQMVVFKCSAAAGDYEYLLTDMGRDRTRRYLEECSYYGSATVTLKDYLHAMAAQSIAKQHATEADLHRAFADLIINERMLDRLGPAINSGRGMFLFGQPGNGKTSIAERITSCFGSTIWIPKALSIDGDIIRLYDPSVHYAIKQEQTGGFLDNSSVDQRWVQITRPTIVAGGELTMAELEVRQNPQTKICESPLQLKSNCGIFVIDDFGRQRMPVFELLNRWIVPLEKRYDFLNLPSGKKVQVPFDQLIIFSTNLEPKDLVDGAFLRRIPYKIEVTDPSEDEFRRLFAAVAPSQGFTLDREALDAIDYLIATHYKAVNRPFRACQPRDLLLQVRNFCLYKTMPKKVTPSAFDFACDTYFSVM